MTDRGSIRRGLDRAFHATPQERLVLERARLAVLSDQHKGQRDGADDFAECEASYLAALDHYWAGGFDLIVLGDGEELWENRPGRALPAYDNVFRLERRFNDAGRYRRVFGNHDDLWMDADAVARYLVPRLGPIEVREAFRYEVTWSGRVLGELYLVHGHQGTWASDKNRAFTRVAVRHLWRPIQRFFRIRATTPAHDECLREEHDIAMYEWTLGHAGVALIAGHTHRPVWTSKTHVEQMEDQLAALRRRGAPAAEIEALERKIAQRRAKDRYCEHEHHKRALDPRPSYFNSGCGCYADGNVTGIEIEGQEIRLVKWAGGGAAARRDVLSADTLPRVFAELDAGVQSAGRTPTSSR